MVFLYGRRLQLIMINIARTGLVVAQGENLMEKRKTKYI
jgi:hypothetical protein